MNCIFVGGIAKHVCTAVNHADSVTPPFTTMIGSVFVVYKSQTIVIGIYIHA